MENTLKTIIANVFEIPLADVNELTTQDTVENWDSVHHLILILSLEESFNITFSDEETVELSGYKKIKSILSEKGIAF